MFPEHVCGRYQHGTNLVQCHGEVPVLIMPLEHQHDTVTLPDALCHQVGTRLRGETADVAECQHFLMPLLIAPLYRTLFRFLCRNGIYHVISEIEIILIVQRKILYLSFFIECGCAEFMKQRFHFQITSYFQELRRLPGVSSYTPKRRNL